MDMVGHQRIGMELATAGFQCLRKPLALRVVIVLAEEAGVPIVASLHNVQRQARKMDA